MKGKGRRASGEVRESAGRRTITKQMKTEQETTKGGDERGGDVMEDDMGVGRKKQVGSG